MDAPGHGDIYTALVTSGILEQLLTNGYEYAFVSNADNLGAALDLRILGHFAAHNIPFLMEVAERTAADRKGGHLALRPDGQLILRESAQCPPQRKRRFQDIQYFQYFNTNNLWLNLRALSHLLEARDGVIPLPSSATKSLWIPAIPARRTRLPAGNRHGLRHRRLSRRPGPVRAAQPLCAGEKEQRPASSHVRCLPAHARFTLTLAPERAGAPPVVLLDDRYYLLNVEMMRRFPHGPPSLRSCTDLRVDGDVHFGRNVGVTGTVVLTNPDPTPMWVPDDTELQ